MLPREALRVKRPGAITAEATMGRYQYRCVSNWSSYVLERGDWTAGQGSNVRVSSHINSGEESIVFLEYLNAKGATLTPKRQHDVIVVMFSHDIVLSDVVTTPRRLL